VGAQAGLRGDPLHVKLLHKHLDIVGRDWDGLELLFTASRPPTESIKNMMEKRRRREREKKKNGRHEEWPMVMVLMK
jgi:hypothetical protein